MVTDKLNIKLISRMNPDGCHVPTGSCRGYICMLMTGKALKPYVTSVLSRCKE